MKTLLVFETKQKQQWNENGAFDRFSIGKANIKNPHAAWIKEVKGIQQYDSNPATQKTKKILFVFYSEKRVEEHSRTLI